MFKQNYDDVLELCLDRLQKGESVESCLKDHPIYAHELKGPLELANQFRQFPPQKPSLAADFFFQQQLEQHSPVQAQTHHFRSRGIYNPLRTIGRFLFEFGFMALMIVVISFVFISHSNLLIHDPVASHANKVALSYSDLSNLTYEGDLIGRIALQNGSYPLVSKDYAGNPHEIQLDRQVAFGDLDNDGWEDAAAILYWRDASAAPLWALAIVRNDQGVAKNVTTLFIGPNLLVDELKIENQKVNLTVVDSYGVMHKRVYQLDGSQLVLHDYELLNVSPKPMSMSLLQELSYPIEGRAVSFKTGYFYGEAYRTQVLDSINVPADSAADNEGDENRFVVLLTQSTSHAGSIYYLVVETNVDAEAIPIRTAASKNADSRVVTAHALGHYLDLDSVQVVDGELRIEISTQGKNDLIAPHVIETTYRFAWVGNELVALSDN